MGLGTNKLCFKMTASSLLSSLSEAKDALGVRWMLLGLHSKRPYVCLTQMGAGYIHGVEKLCFHFLSGSFNLFILLLTLPLPVQSIQLYQVQYGVKAGVSAVPRKSFSSWIT